MTLPPHNPIDFEWFARGMPIDHLGTRTLACRACGQDTMQECFKIIAGNSVGFGAPFFAKPFMKRSSTIGKVGGTRGEVSQCTVCDSLWPMTPDGAAALMKMDLPHDGLVNPNFQYEAENRAATKAESDGVWDPPDTPTSKVRKARG